MEAETTPSFAAAIPTGFSTMGGLFRNRLFALQLAVMDTEEHLQASRRLYNGNVAAYNERLVTFPSSLAAAFAKAKPRPFFRADAEQRDDVKMRF